MLELTEKEFLTILKERIKKAQDMGNLKMYNEHVNLLKFYEEHKNKGYSMKYYMDNGGLTAIPYTKDEIKIIEKKYREIGIW